MDPVASVTRHPRLNDLARSPREDARMRRFAHDLARWLHGTPRSELGALARVVTIVAQRELGDARILSRERPLVAIEAAARATEALWPLLRGPELPDPASRSTEDDGDGAGEGDGQGEDAGGGAPGGGASGEEGEADGAGGAAESDDGDRPEEGESEDDTGPGSMSADDDAPQETSTDPLDALNALADMGEVVDPELDALAERLRERMEEGDDAEVEAGELLQDAAIAGAEGAFEMDTLALELDRFVPGIGWSGAPGDLQPAVLERLSGLAGILEAMPDLRALADAIGRAEEPTDRKGWLQGGREDLVGIHLGGEVSLALPSELALLADEDTEDLFYQRLTERRLVSLELAGEGVDGVAAGDKRGPVIACIDTSGSMQGPAELGAKALVLAVCRTILPRNRAVHLLLFGGQGERTELRLSKGRGGLEGLLGFLDLSFRSGTDFDGPLLRAMELLEEEDLKQADILVVTDGLCRATREVVDRVVAVRDATGARVWSVVLGRHDVRGVEPFSHKVYALDPTDAAVASGLLRDM